MRSRLLSAGLYGALLILAASEPVFAQEEVAPAALDAVNTLARMIRWSGIASSLLVIGAAWLLLRFVTRLVDQLSSVFVERRLALQKFTAFFRFGVYFATITVVVLLSLEISREVLTILGGTVAVAIGFAMKDLVASLVAGVMIMFDRPFQVGDRVTFGGQYGDIVTIGLRSVKLRTLGDSMVTIPNNLFLNEVTSCGNYGVLNMQVQTDFLIGVDQDVDRAREIVRESAVTSGYIHLSSPVEVLVTQVVVESYVAVRLRLKAYVLDTRYENVFETDVTLRVMDAFAAEGIQPPAILHRQYGSPSPAKGDDLQLAS